MMNRTLIRQRPQANPVCRGRRLRPSREDCRYGLSPRAMRHPFLTQQSVPPPAPVMMGSAATNGVTTGTSMAITMPGSIVAGETLVCAVGGSRAAALGTTAMAGWTKALECSLFTGGAGGFLSIWSKVAVGGDTATFSVGTGNSNMTAVTTRWAGVGSVSVGLTGTTDSTSGSVTLSCNTVTTTVPNSVVFSAAGGRTGTGGDVSPSTGGPTWGAGASTIYGTASGRLGYCNLGGGTKTTPGAVTHTAVVRNTQSPPINCVGSIILAP